MHASDRNATCHGIGLLNYHITVSYVLSWMIFSFMMNRNPFIHSVFGSVKCEQLIMVPHLGPVNTVGNYIEDCSLSSANQWILHLNT